MISCQRGFVNVKCLGGWKFHRSVKNRRISGGLLGENVKKAGRVSARPAFRPRLVSGRASFVTLRSGQDARSLSLRLRQNPVPLRGPWAFAFAPLQAPSLPASPRFSCHAAKPPRRDISPPAARKPIQGPAPPPWAFLSAPALCPCSRLLRASFVTLRSGQDARSLSLRLRQNPIPLRGPWAFAFAPLQAPSLPASPRFFCHAAKPPRRGISPPAARKPIRGPAAPSLGFPLRSGLMPLLPASPRFF